MRNGPSCQLRAVLPTNLKDLMQSYIRIITCFGPCSCKFSVFRCCVISVRKAWSERNVGSLSWGTSLSFIAMNNAISCLNSKNLCNTFPLLSHLTSVWYSSFPYSVSKRVKNDVNCLWLRPLARMKLTVLTTTPDGGGSQEPTPATGRLMTDRNRHRQRRKEGDRLSGANVGHYQHQHAAPPNSTQVRKVAIWLSH